MKRKLSALSGRYLAALRKHLKEGPRAGLEPARELGCQAVAIGLETLEVVRIHERALATLAASGGKDGFHERAKAFFTEAIAPLEETQGAALNANARLNRLNQTLGLRTLDLAASNRSLKQGMVRRKTVEAALKEGGSNSKKLWAESCGLQKRLRHLTRQILTAQENNRKKISRELQDEIAQTLLEINVRLWRVKKQAAVSAQGFKKEIANTQRLVDMSVKTIERLAREFGQPHET